MENQKDWKELEQWAENQKQSRIDNYKIDTANVEELQSRRKKMDKFFAPMDKVLKKFKKILIIISSFAVLIGFIVLVSWLASVKSSVNADIDTALNFWGVETEIVSTDVDNHDNGKYIMIPKNHPELQFTANKRWGLILTDFEDSYQKYLFEHWESDRKENFSATEEVESGLLVYENYVTVNENETLEEATEDIIRFIEYAESWNAENNIINLWQWSKEYYRVPLSISIYLEDRNTYLYNIYTGSGHTADKIRENVRKEFLTLPSL